MCSWLAKKMAFDDASYSGRPNLCDFVCICVNSYYILMIRAQSILPCMYVQGGVSTFLPFRKPAGRSLTDFLASAIEMACLGERMRSEARPEAPTRRASAARTAGVKPDLATAGACANVPKTTTYQFTLGASPAHRTIHNVCTHASRRMHAPAKRVCTHIQAPQTFSNVSQEVQQTVVGAFSLRQSCSSGMKTNLGPAEHHGVGGERRGGGHASNSNGGAQHFVPWRFAPEISSGFSALW
jgi:hypothetical protein